MAVLEPDMVPQRNIEVVWREDDEDVFICSTDGETIFSITAVGADIWRVCDGTHTIAEITELLLTAYDIDRDILEKDTEEFLLDLKAKELVSFH